MRANGSIVAFDGFLKLYREGSDEEAAESAEGEDNRVLPSMAERDRLVRKSAAALQHFTQPPPRFSEASLVQKMEEAGDRPAFHLCLDPVRAARPQLPGAH